MLWVLAAIEPERKLHHSLPAIVENIIKWAIAFKVSECIRNPSYGSKEKTNKELVKEIPQTQALANPQ